MQRSLNSFMDFFYEKVAYYSEVSPSTKVAYPLHKAVENGNVFEIFKVLNTIPVDSPKANGATALIQATLKPFTPENRRIIKILLRKGADPLKKFHYRSAAYNIFVQNDMDLMLTVLQFIDDVNDSVHYDKKLLDTALKKRNSTIVQILLDKGANFRKKDHKETTYLHEAVCSAERPLVEIFLKTGLDINSRDRLQRTPLHYAVLGSATDCLEEILKAKPELNPIDKEGNTPLNLAVKENDQLSEDMLELLLKYDSDPNIADGGGCTPLHNLFFGSGLRSIAKAMLLVGHGANMNIRNNCGKTPLHLALEHGYDGCAPFLVKNGADINIRSSGYMTPFHTAYCYDHMYVVRFMIRHLAMSKHLKNKEIGKNVMTMIESDSELLTYLEDCEKEVLELKCRLGDSNFMCAEGYWYNRRLIGCIRNDTVKNAIHAFDSSKFPFYGRDIRRILRKGLYRRHLEDVAEEYFSGIFGQVLPHTCVTNIVKSFTKDELRCLVDEFYNRYDRKVVVKRAKFCLHIGMAVIYYVFIVDGLI